MNIWEPKIRKTSVKFLTLAFIKIILISYLFVTIGYKKVDAKTQSAVALTGLFILVVFLIAFGKVYYQKTAENNKKKNEKDKLTKYDHANLVQWIAFFISFIAGAYFYALRQDMSYFGICIACLAFFIHSFPSWDKFKNDFY